MSTPAGWYPDPNDPSRMLWWDGVRWVVPPAPTPPAEPFPQSAPGAWPGTASGAAPAWPGSAAPMPGGSAWPTPAPPVVPAVAASPPHPEVATETPWIWLVVLLPVLSTLSVFLVDWRGYIDTVMQWSMYGGGRGALPPAFSSGTVSMTLLGLGGTLAAGLVVLFAWLDWRELRSRGIPRPFHWAFAFLALVVTNGVYVIGRAVVLRRETGKGLTSLWVWIGVTVLSWIVAGIFTVQIMNDVMEMISQYTSSR